MTEEQRYDVVGRYPGFELRRYSEHLVAEITVDGSFESAGNRAFMPLAGYIGGRNRFRAKVAMTAPVIQEPAGSTRIAMTAPVVQQASPRTGQYVVSFVMPARYTERTLPEPTDPRISVRVVPEQHAAAVRYSGRWSRGAYQARERRLLAAVRQAGFAPVAPARFARYNPPWTPWFLRRNEVVVPVRPAH